MKIYTKTGDKGETSLFGGKRVRKDDQRIKAYGTVDELNAILGVAHSELINKELKDVIVGIQNDLFTVGSDLSSPLENENKNYTIPRANADQIIRLENLIDQYDSLLPPLKNFILPGGLKGAAVLHQARTVCRRAEREVVALAGTEEINDQIEVYLNRLSDMLFVLARFENFSNYTSDITWKK
ncbi:MAG: ATP:cob(I)alamin adenosyltransferase [Ignavibacteriae bacterium HGW-Ignavibacteriae-3]|nr:MAG: ATP:cob(I)alamin adenosyltransferase [Ignavibacteriae bacterium HGW-Ignavibacteriae-3]